MSEIQIKTTDPVCGMKVDQRTARSSAYEGSTFFFCSVSCQQTFDAEPKAILARATGRQKDSPGGTSDEHGCCSTDVDSAKKTKPPSDPGAIYTCPMHQEVEQVGPCLLYTSPSPRDATLSRMPSSA